VELVENLACPSCKLTILDTRDKRAAQRAQDLGIRAVSAVAVDGKLLDRLDCCRGGVDEQALRAAGIGSPVS